MEGALLEFLFAELPTTPLKPVNDKRPQLCFRRLIGSACVHVEDQAADDELFKELSVPW